MRRKGTKGTKGGSKLSTIEIWNSLEKVCIKPKGGQFARLCWAPAGTCLLNKQRTHSGEQVDKELGPGNTPPGCGCANGTTQVHGGNLSVEDLLCPGGGKPCECPVR